MCKLGYAPFICHPKMVPKRLTALGGSFLGASL